MTRFVSVTSVPRFRLPVKNENKKQKKRPPPAGLRPRSGSERARGSPKRAGQKHRRIPVHGYFPGGDGRRAADGGEFFFCVSCFFARGHRYRPDNSKRATGEGRNMFKCVALLLR